MKRRDFFGTILAGLVAAKAAPVSGIAIARAAAPVHPGIVSNGWATIFSEGDVITIDGYFGFDPRTHKQTNRLQRWRVGVVGDSTVSIEPIPADS
jgi:hypothetical protein